MKSPRRGKTVSASVENIAPFGIWLFVKGKEYLLSYRAYPYFQDQTLSAIQNVQLLHGYHFWPQLDVDLEIDILDHPEKYPLRPAKSPPPAHRSNRRTTQKLDPR